VRLTRIILTAFAVAVCMPSVGSAQYAPKWQVGDWWIVKTWWKRQSSLHRTAWEWKYRRYDVAGIEKAGQNDCYVIEIRGDRQPNIRRDGTAGRLLYVCIDNWLVVRTEEARYFDGKRLSPYVGNYPLGLFGPFVPEPRLPRFPLRLMNRDTTFKRERRDDCYADLREISRPADSVLVKRLLAEGDTTGGRPVRPTAAVYEVRSELGGDFGSGSFTDRTYVRQSLQLWSDDLPWRPFEELVEYSGSSGAPKVTERSWLIAVGNRER
jgi:hypothetical protein